MKILMDTQPWRRIEKDTDGYIYIYIYIYVCVCVRVRVRVCVCVRARIHWQPADMKTDLDGLEEGGLLRRMQMYTQEDRLIQVHKTDIERHADT
jgi:hypothetical protein